MVWRNTFVVRKPNRRLYADRLSISTYYSIIIVILELTHVIPLPFPTKIYYCILIVHSFCVEGCCKPVGGSSPFNILYYNCIVHGKVLRIFPCKTAITVHIFTERKFSIFHLRQTTGVKATICYYFSY